MSVKKALKFCFVGCLASITLFISFIIFVIGLLLGSQTTREWLVQDITPKIFSSRSTQLIIKGLSSPRFDTWSFDTISYSIDDKILFDAHTLLLKFDSSMLLDKKIDVIELSTNKLVIAFPETITSEKDTINESHVQKWQDYLVPLRLQNVDVNHLDITFPKIQIPTLQMRGSASVIWGNTFFNSDLIIKTSAKENALFKLQTNIDEHFSGELKAHIQEAAGGWIGDIINLPPEQAVDLNIHLNATQDDETVKWELLSFNMPWQAHKISALGQGNWLTNEHRLRVSDLSIFVDDHQQYIDGWWQAHAFQINASLNTLPISLSALFQDYVTDGNITGTLNASGTVKNPSFNTNISMHTSYNKKAVTLSLRGEGNFDTFKIEHATLNLGDAMAETSGAIFLDKQELDLQIHQLNGPVQIIETFNIKFIDHLSLDIKNAHGILKGPFTSPEYTGFTQATGQYKKKPFTLQSDFIGNLEKVTISNTLATFSDSALIAEGLIDWQNEQLDIVMDAQNIELSLFRLLPLEIPSELTGNISAKGTIQGKLLSPSFNGHTSASIAFRNMFYEMKSELEANTEQVQINSFSSDVALTDERSTTHKAYIRAKGRYNISTKEIDGQLSIDALPYQVVELFDVKLPPALTGVVDTKLKLSGQLPVPILQGTIKSEGAFENESFNFNFIGSQADKILRFDNANIKWRNTILAANGFVSKDNLDLKLTLQDLKIADLNKFGFDLKPGSLDINLNLLGTLDTPDVDGLITLTVDKQIISDDINTPLADIVVTTSLKTDNDLLVINSDVIHGQTDKGNIQIKSTFKPMLKWLLNEYQTKKFADIPLNINARGDVGLNWLNNFIDRDIQNITGKLTINTQLNGSLNSPSIKGALALSNGQYVNALSQTSVENAEIELAFNEKSISIIKAQASDGQKGTLNIFGSASLADNDDGNIDITLKINKASLVRREDIEGDATGIVKLSGSLKEIVVSGNVDVSPFQIMLDLIPTDSIPEIEVTLKEDSKSASKNKITAPPILLNIKVDVEQQAYIRGRGLYAELKGNLSLSGTSKKPNYNGQFTIVRGTFELFSKTFKLEEGDVLFSNDAVSLFVQGRHTGKEITFIASLSGTLDNLKIALTTEPALPEDEALARLLFGKSVRNITPIQAIQLASAIQTLRGEGGFDPLGKARELFHVDTISVESQETSEGNGLAVGVGKYITEDVYVELTRTPDPAQPWKGTVEVELSPSINLETTTGGSSGFGGVELQWKKDY